MQTGVGSMDHVESINERLKNENSQGAQGTKAEQKP